MNPADPSSIQEDPTLAKALAQAPLGKRSPNINTYSPSLLFPISRKPKRDEIGISDPLPFKGYDIWNGFELSWLNLKGKPVVATAEFLVPCESPYIFESKSFKLYLNSFNNSKFESFEKVRSLLESDLSFCAGDRVSVRVFTLDEVHSSIGKMDGLSLDDLDIECSEYLPQTQFLSVEKERLEEVLHTHLLKSNCLVTGQPDWGSVQIEYFGNKINHEGLLKYIVSLRNHEEFHEQCVERIFTQIQNICKPQWLTVYARYTRRGGLDINPYRSNKPSFKLDPRDVKNIRLARQ